MDVCGRVFVLHASCLGYCWGAELAAKSGQQVWEEPLKKVQGDDGPESEESGSGSSDFQLARQLASSGPLLHVSTACFDHALPS